MVCHGNRWHIQLLGAVRQSVDAAGTVKQAVVGVEMEMNDGVFSGCHCTYNQGLRQLPQVAFAGKLLTDLFTVESEPPRHQAAFPLF